MSWSLSPQELSDTGCTASLWRSFQQALAALVAAILPPITLHMLTKPSAKMHARLANPKRRRKPAISWPIRGLS
jgi:hypothetical protein